MAALGGGGLRPERRPDVDAGGGGWRGLRAPLLGPYCLPESNSASAVVPLVGDGADAGVCRE